MSRLSTGWINRAQSASASAPCATDRRSVAATAAGFVLEAGAAWEDLLTSGTLGSSSIDFTRSFR